MSTQYDPKKSALLLLDFQNGLLPRLPADTAESIVDNAASAIATARLHGTHVAYIRVALDEADLDAVPEHSAAFASFKGSKDMKDFIHPDSLGTQIHPKLAPKEGDIVHRKIRYGAFMRGPSVAMLADFKAKGINTVILGGIVTSGAVLSAVRQLSDLDYRLAVLEDCCADHEVDVHKMLCEKIFPRQATVVKTAELDSLF